MHQRLDESISSFKVTCDIEIRFSDTDAMGHVNNAVYLTYIEVGRLHYWRALMGIKDYRQVNFILAHVSIDYISPLYVGEVVVVGVARGEIRGASFDFHYSLWEKTTKRIVATAASTQVMYDYKAGKPIRIAQDCRQRMLNFEQ